MSDNLERIAQLVASPFGAAYWLSFRLESNLSANSLARQGDSLLSGAIQCIIVGNEDQSLLVLKMASQWLTEAIVQIERGGKVSWPYATYFDLHLCRWLLGEMVPPFALAPACLLLKEHHEAVSGSALEVQWEYSFPRLVDAGESEYCIASFEQYHPQYPTARRRRHTPDAMAYLIARNGTRPALSEQKFAQTAQDFMTQRVPEWLLGGHYRDFAIWTKVLFRASSGEEARKSLRETAIRFA